MIARTTVHVSDYGKSKAFYVQCLAPLGYHDNMEVGEAAGVLRRQEYRLLDCA